MLGSSVIGFILLISSLIFIYTLISAHDDLIKIIFYF